MRILDKLIASWRVFVGVLLAALVLASAYLVLAEKRYEAEAKLQITPLAADDRTFVGFSLLRESRDDATPGETAADLVESTRVADAVAERLNEERDELLDAVTATAEGASNVVAVRARSSEPRRAAQVANGFASELVSQRASQFQEELERTVARLRERLATVPATQRLRPPVSELAQRLAELQTYVGEPDPTLKLASTAVASERHSWPRAVPVLATALGAATAVSLTLALVLALRDRETFVRYPAAKGDDELGTRVTQLEQRVRLVTQRERALGRRAGELAAREHALQERENVLGLREDGLADRARVVAEREQALDRRTVALDERESALLERAEAVAERERAPAAPTPAAAVSEAPAAWTLPHLERLVEERSAEFPELVEGWRSYLFFLRDHATSEGRLPARFEALIDEVFGDLLR